MHYTSGVLTMASDWEEKFRAELREAFEAVSESSPSIRVASTVPSPLLAKWQQIGYEKLNESYLVLSQTVDDLRTTAACGFDGMLTSNGLALIADAFDWIDAAGDALHRLPALVVIRAACLDVLRAYALHSDPTIPRTPLQNMVNPKREELIPASFINEALIVYPIPLLGKQHVLKRTPSRHGRVS